MMTFFKKKIGKGTIYYTLSGQESQGKFSSGKTLVTFEKLVTFTRLIF